MAEIHNDKPNKLLSGTSGDDSIKNSFARNVTINGGAGNDSILGGKGNTICAGLK